MNVSTHSSVPGALRPNGVIPTASHALFLAGGVAAILALAGTSHELTALAIVICLIVVLPVLLHERDMDLFSPWNYMFYYVILNILVRSAFIDFDIVGDVVSLNDIFFLDKPRDFLVESTAVMLFGFFFLTLGYLLVPNEAVALKWRIFRTDQFSRGRFKVITVAMLLCSMVAFVLFVYFTFTSVGDFAFKMLSSHRGLAEDIRDYRAYGYLRLLIGLSSIVAYTTYLRLRTERRGRWFYRLCFVSALLVSLAMAFYSQSRAALVFVFLNIVFMKYYLDGQRFPWRLFVIFAPMAVMLFFVTSALRTGSGVELGGRITPLTVVAPIILNNGGIDASKTGHVIDYIDQTQDYRLGQTLVQFIWAAVPRQVWADKPVNLDTFVGEKIYGAQTFGAGAVPPGLFSEMYMNYWYAGIMMGALLLGMLMKKINNLLVTNKHNENFVVFYVIALQSIGMSVLGSGVSSTVMGVLMSGVPLVLVLYIVTPRERVARRGALQA